MLIRGLQLNLQNPMRTDAVTWVHITTNVLGGPLVFIAANPHISAYASCSRTSTISQFPAMAHPSKNRPAPKKKSSTKCHPPAPSSSILKSKSRPKPPSQRYARSEHHLDRAEPRAAIRQQLSKNTQQPRTPPTLSPDELSPDEEGDLLQFNKPSDGESNHAIPSGDETPTASDRHESLDDIDINPEGTPAPKRKRNITIQDKGLSQDEDEDEDEDEDKDLRKDPQYREIKKCYQGIVAVFKRH